MKNITCCALLFLALLHTHLTHAAAKDHGCLPTTTVLTAIYPSMCQSTLPSINTLIGITTVAGPTTRYRIRAIHGADVQIIEKGVPHFTMMQFPLYAFSTTYTIQIELQRGGIWEGVYGPACEVTTPAGASGASLIAAQCGIELPKLTTMLETPSLQYVSGYRYRVTNLTDPFGPYAVQIYDRPLNWFTLTMLNRYNYGTTYRVEVALRTFGIYGDYGAACEVSTPPPPVLAHCDAVIATGNTLVACGVLPLVTQYRFQVVRQSDNASATIDRGYANFSFCLLPASAFSGGELYDVRIAVMTAASWSPYGDACTITAPASANRMQEESALVDANAALKAVAYPNPFVDEFTLALTAAAPQPTVIEVHDLWGRVLESKTTESVEAQQITLGSQLPAGRYTVYLRMGEAVQVLRMLKK